MKNIKNVMRPDTRLTIYLEFIDGSMRGWGYDYPHYPTIEVLKKNIAEDFSFMPDNVSIKASYNDHETKLNNSTADDFAQQVIDWLVTTGDFA